MKLTLLFSDIEGSTRLLTQLGARYGETLSIQRSIMREEFVCAHGHEVGTEGDSFFVVFPTVTDAATAVVAAQRRLAARDWPGGVAVRVRMGLHTGQPVPLDDDYVGLDVHRAARIAATAHGGQVVVSGVTAQLLGEVSVPLSLKDLGWHRLKDIPEPEHIFQLVAEGLEQAFPPLRSLGTPTNLPPSPTPIIGRDLELTEIATQFTESEARLVTVTGPGGCGKTRLAIAVAERIGSSRADGVYFVDLATARTSEMVWSAIAETLGIRDDGRSPRSLIGYLRDRDMLLILDNLEQVTDAATVVGDLLTQAPNVVLLATSRRPLRLMGEYQLPVPPLDTPVRFGSAAAASTAGAVALFVHRAQMVRPSFRLTEDNVDDVATICSRLDGMPLAIELAAARAKVLSPHAILARLDRSLELSSTELGRPTRQRTLRQTIGWSVDLLNEDQQRFFRHFGVYGSSCDLEALAAIADTSGDPLDQVAELVDVSLLTILDDPSGEPRVTLLQTVRAYARELLRSAGEWESTARRHAEYYIGVMSELMPRLRTTEYLTTRDRIETELGNVRSALEWSLSMDDRDAGDVMLGFRICHEMSWFWYACGHAEEGRQWLELATERMEAEGPEEMAVLHGLAVILLQQGEQTAAQQLLLRCLEYWRARDDDRETAKELNSLGVVYRNLG
ncbi:MAG TPA: adenylate/guanylate cyclase domain-containing protein, partial [Microlunatus sp.]|nr:adenylate/guanylate cyclase domain-containing protein [Microlunatus sp.]